MEVGGQLNVSAVLTLRKQAQLFRAGLAMAKRKNP
jgi:hypothetical protein